MPTRELVPTWYENVLPGQELGKKGELGIEITNCQQFKVIHSSLSCLSKLKQTKNIEA